MIKTNDTSRERLSQPDAGRRPCLRGRSAAGGSLSLLLCSLLLAGCTTLQPTPKSPAVSTRSPVPATVSLEPLRVGMSMGEVEKLEPRPKRILTMRSQGMTVVKWVYSNKGRRVELYFENGFLSSWQE